MITPTQLVNNERTGIQKSSGRLKRMCAPRDKMLSKVLSFIITQSSGRSSASFFLPNYEADDSSFGSNELHSSVATQSSSDRVVWWGFEHIYSMDNPTVSIVYQQETQFGNCVNGCNNFISLFAVSSNFQLKQLSRLLEA
jgi:hypothetical protein